MESNVISRSEEPISNTFLTDNLSYMKCVPDNFFDLAVCDPEYRDVNQPDINLRKKGSMIDWKGMPKEEYFQELFRISKHQIIFGGNYFTHFLEPNNNWFVWDKVVADKVHFSMAEMAWVSIRKNIKIFKHRPIGDVSDWHETSKPRVLYDYIFKMYAENGWKILDTNLGSGTSRQAAWNLGLDFWGCEINPTYYEKQEKDFNKFCSSFGLFKNIPEKKKQMRKIDIDKALGDMFENKFDLGF